MKHKIKGEMKIRKHIKRKEQTTKEDRMAKYKN